MDSETEGEEEGEKIKYYALQSFLLWIKTERGKKVAHLENLVSSVEGSNNLSITCGCGANITIYSRDNGSRFDVGKYNNHNNTAKCGKSFVLAPKTIKKRKISERLNESESKRARIDDDEGKVEVEDDYESADEEEYDTADEESLDDKIAECFKIYYSEGIYYCYDKERGKIIFSIVFCIFY